MPVGAVEEKKEKFDTIHANEEGSKEPYVRWTWDEYFIEVVKVVGGRSTCDRGRSGCVITKNNRILCTGYIGSPSGIDHCDDIGHEFKKTIHEDGSISNHCVRTSHAEQNAIVQAARYGTSIDGSTIYVNMTPCYTCAKMIISAGIKRVVARKDYHAAEDSKRIFEEAGIDFEIVEKGVLEYSKQT
ncbi:cytidine/deoxycytidylate deaminase family protein [Patescibacteria group bacterium]